jgi:hypothetical protein
LNAWLVVAAGALWLPLWLGCPGTLRDPQAFLEAALDAGDTGGSGNGSGGTAAGIGGSGSGLSGGSVGTGAGTGTSGGAPDAGDAGHVLPPSCNAPEQVFQNSCLPCHSSSAPQSDLDLSSPYALLNVDSAFCFPWVFIVPGQLATSLLWQMVTCSGDSCPCASAGFSPMPLQPNEFGINPLTESEKSCIGDWIENLDGG